MYYSIKNIASLIPLHNRTISDVFTYNRIPACFTLGQNHQNFYSIFKMELFKNKLEEKKRDYKVLIDFKSEEVFVVFESKINYLF
jgi:hypothetical protein